MSKFAIFWAVLGNIEGFKACDFALMQSAIAEKHIL